MIRAASTLVLSIIVDLHCHSDRSDGALAPAALLARAAHRGVRLLSLTDHDTLEGLDEARVAAERLGVGFIDGVEISVTWSGRTLHVLGLDVDTSCDALRAGLRCNQELRSQRAERIDQRLAAVGIGNCLQGAVAYAGGGSVGRFHFARHLVALGVVSDMKTAFRRFLGEGKPGYVRIRWAALLDAIDWIRQSGGVAVLAHPLRYGLRAARLRELLVEFRALGGTGVEVVTASHNAEQSGQIARLATELGLLASAGSDFHSEDSWWDVGTLPDMPSFCTPVWDRWAERCPAQAQLPMEMDR